MIVRHLRNHEDQDENHVVVFLRMEECFLLLSLVACCLCLFSCFSLYELCGSDLESNVPALLSGKPYLSSVSWICGFSKETLPQPYIS